MRRPAHLIPGTARNKVKCDECDKKIKVGDAYLWSTVRQKTGELTVYRRHVKCPSNAKKRKK